MKQMVLQVGMVHVMDTQREMFEKKWSEIN